MSWFKFPPHYPADIIQDTQIQRQLIIQTIQALKESDFQKIGYHPKFKKLTLINWIEFFLLHESHHSYTIFRIIHEFNTHLTK